MTQAPSRQGDASAAFTLSAFGDEIDPDLDAQLKLLHELRIGSLDLRHAWGANVMTLDDGQVTSVKRACESYGISISCIGSPIGKTPITEALDAEMSNLARAFRIAKDLGTRMVRIFSFYPPDKDRGGQQDRYLGESISRLTQMAHEAEQNDILLLMENDRGMVGDTPERCHAILEAVGSPNLRFLWDTSNFAWVGVTGSVDSGWPLLGPYISYVQVKDFRISDGVFCVAGAGDGQVPELLTRLRDKGYRGVLALEPTCWR